MKKFQIQLNLFLIILLCSQVVAQNNWKNIKTIEDLYESYPNRLEFLFDQLDLNYDGLGEVKKSYEEKDLVTAARKLLTYYKKNGKLDSIRKKQPIVTNESVSKSDTILKNVFTIQNVKSKLPILKDSHRDWYYKGPFNDEEWAWLSNRHSQLSQVFQSYLETGNPKYALYVDEFLRDFIIKSWPYPKKKSTTSVWRGLEVSFRAKKWSDIFYSSLNFDQFYPATHLLILISLAEHAHYNYNFHSKKDNWLTMEISALTKIASFFPEYKLSNQWIDYSIKEMTKSMQEQIYPDGVQTELSSHYHNVSLKNFELFNDLCILVGRDLPDYYLKTIEQMYNYSARVMRPDGSRPLNNDSDRGNQLGKTYTFAYDNRQLIMDGYKKYNNPEWLFIATNGKKGIAPKQKSFFYPWAGQLISRSGYDKLAHWAFFDVGPWGSGHQHQDKLHLSISAYGYDFLVDSGRFAYKGVVADKFRSFARGSSAHNVVLIDNKNQSPGPEKTLSPQSIDKYRITENYDYAFGTFNNFIELKGEAEHTRALFYLRDQFWLVLDHISTDRPRNLKFLWHWHPKCRVIQESINTRGVVDKKSLTIMPLSNDNFKISQVSGQENPNIQGWYSSEYNLYEPNILTEYSVEIDKTESFLWLLIPENNSKRRIKTNILEFNSSGFDVEIFLDNESWIISIPLKSSFDVELVKKN